MPTANWEDVMEKAEPLGSGISLLVPLHLNNQEERARNWNWLKAYWKANLPGAEIVIGSDEEAQTTKVPFSKSVAVNNAASVASGDVFVIIDADVYISIETILRAAKEIRLARKRGYRLWLMPYRRMYRLTAKASSKVLKSDPKSPFEYSCPPPDGSFTNTVLHQGIHVTKIGHWYGAMIQIMPKEAFELVGGWDPRFKGWGGEDHAAMVAMDTLYSPHKTLPDQVLHLWHPVHVPEKFDDAGGKQRRWENQTKSNDILSGRYYWSNGHPRRMRKLVDEFKDENHRHREHHRHHHKHRHPPCSF